MRSSRQETTPDLGARLPPSGRSEIGRPSHSETWASEASLLLIRRAAFWACAKHGVCPHGEQHLRCCAANSAFCSLRSCFELSGDLCVANSFGTFQPLEVAHKRTDNAEVCFSFSADSSTAWKYQRELHGCLQLLCLWHIN